MIRWIALFSFTVLGMTDQLLAQLPTPTLVQVYPLGGQVGSTVDLEIGGNNLQEVKVLFADHPGITGTLVEGKEKNFTLTIGPDVPPGIYDLRAIGKFGVSGARCFQVLQGLTEVLKVEPNNAIEQSQPVPINCAINGRSDGSNLDYFKVELKTNQRIVIDVEIQKLEVQLDGNITVYDSNARPLVTSGDYHGRDSFVDFVAPVDGTYYLSFNDLSYRGGSPYRILVTDQPHLETLTPRVIQVGKPTDIFCHGQNVGGELNLNAKIGSVPLEVYKTSITVPSLDGTFHFINHPIDYSPLPTAATSRIHGMQLRPNAPKGQPYNALTAIISEDPVLQEVEPNDKSESAQRITIPSNVDGQFQIARDADWYQFTTEEKGSYSFDVLAESIGCPTDPYIFLFNEKGERISNWDDFGHRHAAFDGHLRDPVGQFNLEENKTYRVMVQDRYGRGGVRYQYVLSIRKRQPDTIVCSVQSNNNDPHAVNLWKGGAGYLDVVLNHREGEVVPVTITADNLPSGMHLQPTTIPNDTRGVVTFYCDANAADWNGKIELYAEFMNGEKLVRRPVRNYNRVWNNSGSRPMRNLEMAIRENAPFSLSIEPNTIDIKQGETANLKVKLERRWPEFTGEIKLLPLQFPGQIQMQEQTIAPGQNEREISFKVQDGTKPGNYTLSIQGQAQIPYHVNPEEKNRPNTLVTLPSIPVQLKVIPKDEKK